MSGDRPILVGVDGTPASVAALEWAAAEGLRRDLPVLAAMVHLVAGQIMIGAVPYDALPPHSVEAEHADCVRKLADTVADADTGGVAINQMVVTGVPGEELAKLSHEADLLVVGSHGHNRFAEVVLGSVSSYCVRHSACPVVVIPRRAWDREGASRARH
ncbi:universal stress protein [Kibdelosporangium philippinense]|uniref:Universal stress protein n=1 Tax=Kibdelosporangium philippinense TaxID=211113 RepID=A0ABS8Z9V4_9PSEU|nr:universal stress protein [Kibdelosporangium philippinense]MCE7004643.1 universal stress protein [Kibdelosporangium philippinense]